MSQWIRGPICGVDNCRSRLYRATDGMKICQYGHVMEGNVEINDDQDENFVSTRRLNLQLDNGGFSIASQNVQTRQETSKKVYGTHGKTLYIRCLQVLLKRQMEQLQTMIPFETAELAPVVKLYWIKYLETADIDDRHSKVPGALDLVSILYLAVFRLRGHPIYVCDMIHALKDNRIPYMKCLHLLPKSYLEQLPPYYIKSLEPYKLPLSCELYEAISKNSARICPQDKHLDVPFNYYYSLIFRTLGELLILPNTPELFHMCTNLVEKLDFKFALVFDAKPDRFPDVQIVAFIIFIIKISFVYFNKVNYVKWLDILTKYELSTEFHFANGDINTDELLNWSDFKIDKYCQWIYDNIVSEKNEEDLSIMDKRLFQIFNLDESLNASNKSRKLDHDQDNDPKHVPIEQFLVDIASSNVSPKIKTQDIRIIENKLFDKFTNNFGISRKVLITSYESLELEIKNKLIK